MGCGWGSNKRRQEIEREEQREKRERERDRETDRQTETEGDRAASLHGNRGAGNFLGGILQVQSLNKKAKQDAPFSKYYHFYSLIN